jgi:hypothetical protein
MLAIEAFRAVAAGGSAAPAEDLVTAVARSPEA